MFIGIMTNLYAIGTMVGALDTAVTTNKNNITTLTNSVTALTTTEQANITIPSAWTSGGSGRNFYFRVGNICEVHLDCTPNVHVGGTTIFTLPESCRPVKVCRYSVLPGVSRSSDDGDDHYVIINTNGTVTYTGTGRVFNTFTFICNGG